MLYNFGYFGKHMFLNQFLVTFPYFSRCVISRYRCSYDIPGSVGPLKRPGDILDVAKGTGTCIRIWIQ